MEGTDFNTPCQIDCFGDYLLRDESFVGFRCEMYAAASVLCAILPA